ncbi:MAG: BadF/BadG/BcrA/BcrD ATPase family protein, partial [Opitutales bacterium]
FMAGSPLFWQEYAAGLTGYGRVSADADSLPVLELATGGAPGLVLHAGTGSFICARAPDGAVHYAGGLGWKFGDPGSGFDLGRRGIARALLELQGWTAPGALGRALQAHTGLDGTAALTRFYYNDTDANARIAAFAPVVLELAAAGCTPAQAALTATLLDLADLADLVLARLFSSPPPGNSPSKIPVGVSGAILNSPPAAGLLRGMATARGWPGKLQFITAPPIEGVRRLLARE